MRSTCVSACLLLVLQLLNRPASAQLPPPPNPLLPLGSPTVPAGNPQTAAKIALGQALFWDEQLSLTGTVACGTCHAPQAGGSDLRVVESSGDSRNPGADGQFNTADDVIGAAGVPLHGADGRYQSSEHFGFAAQVGGRQAPSAINAGFPASLFWDGRAGGSFSDPVDGSLLSASGAALENQALGPLVNSAEMSHAGGSLADVQQRIAGVSPLHLAASVPASLSDWIAGRAYPALFSEVFGDDAITAARIAQALASYERSLLANQTPLDAELSGTPSLTALERQGRQVFGLAGCGRCHGGALLSDDNFHYIGVREQAADPGRFAVTGLNADRGRMRTPSLRNIELSPPYMADGRFATLEEVIDFYNRGGDFSAANLAPQITPLNLDADQRAALAAFLRRPLTDPRLASATGPFERPTLYSESAAVPLAVGVGRGGFAGVSPQLIAVEPPLAGQSSFTIAVQDGLANANARLLLDLQEPAQADAPALVSQDFSLSAAGDASLNLTLPDDSSLFGQDLYLRVFVADSAAADGWSATASARFQLLGLNARVFAAGFED